MCLGNLEGARRREQLCIARNGQFVPGEADREVNGESAVGSAKNGRGLRPEVAEAGPALFGPMDGEKAGGPSGGSGRRVGL